MPLTREPPRWLLAPPGFLPWPRLPLGRGDRGRAGWRGGAAAAQGSGSGSGRRCRSPSGGAKRRLRGSPLPPKAAGRVLAARAEHRFFFSLGHCCLGLLPAPDSSEPGAPRMGWGLGLPRADSGEVALGRDAGRPPGPAPPPALPGAASPLQGRAWPAPSPAGRAQPRPQLRAPGLPRGGGAAAVGPGRAPRARRRGCKPAAAPSPGPAPPARGSAVRRRWREGLARAWGAGPGGAGPGEAPWEGHRSGRRGAEPGCGEPRRAAPAASGALAGLGRRRRLRNAPVSLSARYSKLGGRCSRRRQP